MKVVLCNVMFPPKDFNIRLIKCRATGHVSIFWYYHHGSQYLRQYLGRVSKDGKVLLALPEVDLDVLYEIVDKIHGGDVDEDNPTNYGIKK